MKNTGAFKRRKLAVDNVNVVTGLPITAPYCRGGGFWRRYSLLGFRSALQ